MKVSAVTDPINAVPTDAMPHAEQTSMSPVKVPPLCQTERERDRRKAWIEITVRCLTMHAAMVLCFLGVLPAWGLLLVNVVFYPGIYLMLHDLCHAWPVNQSGWICRYLPTANPVWGGIAVFRSTHFRHHKYLGTTLDPWLPFYSGHPLRALLGNYLEPEINLANHLRADGWRRALVKNILFNLSFMTVHLVVFGWVYLMHMGFQRLVHGLGIFWFNFYSHRESLSANAPIGTWNREKEYGRFQPFMRWIWGDVIDGAVYHNRHHIIGQVHQPVRLYHKLSDQGPYTRYIKQWPIATVAPLDSQQKGSGNVA
ncbi:MAG: hypothetical protein P8176_06325 [Gammaproteobacteria bacterium]